MYVYSEDANSGRVGYGNLYNKYTFHLVVVITNISYTPQTHINEKDKLSVLLIRNNLIHEVINLKLTFVHIANKIQNIVKYLLLYYNCATS